MARASLRFGLGRFTTVEEIDFTINAVAEAVGRLRPLSAAGPARGALKVPLERVVVLHDEIDLPFGDIRVRLGGGLAGHNGLKSLRRAFGSPDFWRTRVGVDRPPTTDPDRVAAYVLSRFAEPEADVQRLIASAADAAEQLIREQSAAT